MQNANFYNMQFSLKKFLFLIKGNVEPFRLTEKKAGEIN